MKLSELHNLIHTLKHYGTDLDLHNHPQIFQELGMEPGSIYQELEMESRYVDTHRDSSYSNTHVSLHSHNFYELLYCQNTCGAEYLVGSDRYRLQKGDIILIAPGVSHRPLLPEHMTEPYKRYVLWLSTDFMASLLQAFPEVRDNQPIYSSLLRTSGTHWEALSELFYTGVWESENKNPGWEVAVIGNTIHLLSQLYRAFMDPSTAPMKAEKPELLDQVLGYIEARIGQKITLSDAARHFFVSESNISQTFRNKMGVSFHRCVTQRRLITAKILIAEGMALEQISRQVGFTDYSAFYRAFKQEYGISPREYRNLQDINNRSLH